MAQNKETKKKPQKKTLRYSKLWWAFAGFWVFIFLFFFALSMGCLGFMPSFEELENPHSNLASEVISADGEILGFIGVENRSNVSYDEISPNVINALIATEDVRFYDHSGIDIRSLGRVFTKTIIGRSSSSGGGSTITQQLAKNLFPREKKSKLGIVYSKFKEWIVAAKLEHNYSKSEILTMYLNTVDFGSNAFGIKTASKTFFDKAPSELTVEEAAVLVGLLKAPSTYNPVRNPENALARRNTVLSQMLKYDYLTQEQFDSISAIPINMSRYSPQTHNEGNATYFREFIRAYMKEWCKTHKKPDGEYYDVHKDGLRIYTTIDSRMQRYAEEAVAEHMGNEIQPAFERELKRRKNNSPFVKVSQDQINAYLTSAMRNSDRYRNMRDEGMSEKEIRKAFDQKVRMRIFTWKGAKDTVMSPWDSLLYYKKFLNAGLMSVEPSTGYVKAYVGGINYRYFKFDNVTQSQRQVGSTFKPYVYACAMMNGLTPCTQVPNSEVCFENVDGSLWCPHNSTDARKDEMVTLKWAPANSVNYVSAYLMKYHTNPDQVVELVHKMGIKSDVPAVPAICLGTPDLTVAEMVGAMATFVNHGEHVEPIFITRIEDNKGMVLATFTAERNEALDPQTAYLTVELMKGVVDYGTGGRLRYKYNISYPVAGKTGTTQNNSDAWFIGMTPKLVTGVWIGGEMRSIHFNNMTYGQGAAAALPVWGLYMKKVYDDPKINFYKGNFDRPANIDVELDCSKYQQEAEKDEYEYDF
ncbi:MAG: transglycosylase domain-containing protein [Bacteroidales bacterium]|nr:transglycosylase domain-containing protein [Bacteroidales bacterium]